MALGSRAVDSTGVAAISGAPLRPRHQVHAFTSRLSTRIGRARTVQVRADNALIINAKGETSRITRESSQPKYWMLNRLHMLQGVAMASSDYTSQRSYSALVTASPS